MTRWILAHQSVPTVGPFDHPAPQSPLPRSKDNTGHRITICFLGIRSLFFLLKHHQFEVATVQKGWNALFVYCESVLRFGLAPFLFCVIADFSCLPECVRAVTMPADAHVAHCCLWLVVAPQVITNLLGHLWCIVWIVNWWFNFLRFIFWRYLILTHIHTWKHIYCPLDRRRPYPNLFSLNSHALTQLLFPCSIMCIVYVCEVCKGFVWVCVLLITEWWKTDVKLTHCPPCSHTLACGLSQHCGHSLVWTHM